MKTLSLFPVMLLGTVLAPAQTANPSSKETVPTPDQTTVAPQPSSASKANAVATPPATAADAATEHPANPAPTAADAELQTRIQSALGKDPTVAGGNISVAVSSEGIELSGSVASRQAHVAASRIAKSYAGNKKVVDKITINQHLNDATPDPTPDKINTAGARLRP